MCKRFSSYFLIAFRVKPEHSIIQRRIFQPQSARITLRDLSPKVFVVVHHDVFEMPVIIQALFLSYAKGARAKDTTQDQGPKLIRRPAHPSGRF